MSDDGLVAFSVFSSLLSASIYFFSYRSQRQRFDAIQNAPFIDSADGMKNLPDGESYIALNGYLSPKVTTKPQSGVSWVTSDPGDQLLFVPSIASANQAYLKDMLTPLKDQKSEKLFSYEEVIECLREAKIPKGTVMKERVIVSGQHATILTYVDKSSKRIVWWRGAGAGPFIVTQKSHGALIQAENERLKTRRNWSTFFNVITAGCWTYYIWKLLKKKRFMEQELARVRQLREEGKARRQRNEAKGKAGEGKLQRTVSEQQDDIDNCIICYSEPASIAFVQCGHMNTCRTCADQLRICPICKEPIAVKLTVYT